MAKYIVTFEIDAPNFVAAMALAADSVLRSEDDRSYMTVAPVRVSPAGAVVADSSRMTWSINAQGDARTSPRGGVWMAFDADRERMTVMIMDDVEHTTKTMHLAPESAAMVVRAMRTWPLDLIDMMAAGQERRRNRGGA